MEEKELKDKLRVAYICAKSLGVAIGPNSVVCPNNRAAEKALADLAKLIRISEDTREAIGEIIPPNTRETVLFAVQGIEEFSSPTMDHS